MDVDLVEPVLKLLEQMIGHAAGSREFYLTLGITIAAWVIAVRVCMAMVSTPRGIVAAFFACLVSLSAGLVGYAMVEQYVLAKFESDWAAGVLPLAGLFVFVLASVMVVTKRLLKLSFGGTIFIYIAAAMVATCAYFGVQVVIGLLDAGSAQVEQRELRVKEELETIH